MEPVTFTVLGQPVSMKNSREIVRIKGKPALIKSAEARKYLEDARLQIPQLFPPTMDDVSVTATLFYSDRRRDLDAELLFDALQGKVIVNDRQITEKHLFRKIDKANPRAVVTVEAA